MKSILFFFISCILTTFQVVAQRIITPTEAFNIKGKIKNEVVVTLADLDTFSKVEIKDQIIYNQKGEIKDTVTNMKGILLKSILTSIDYVYEKPKQLNEFYFVLTGSDGYRVVFSWNEIYNTEAGNQFYIVTESGGKTIKEMEERILFISTADLKAGRRYIKGLQAIDVRQLE